MQTGTIAHSRFNSNVLPIPVFSLGRATSLAIDTFAGEEAKIDQFFFFCCFVSRVLFHFVVTRIHFILYLASTVEDRGSDDDDISDPDGGYAWRIGEENPFRG